MLNLVPQILNLPAVTIGDTYPAMQFLETAADTALVSVRMKVKPQAGGAEVLSLSSAVSGITIAGTAAGAWDFTIDRIAAITLDPGWYVYDIETTDENGTITTEFTGSWEILTEVTD